MRTQVIIGAWGNVTSVTRLGISQFTVMTFDPLMRHLHKLFLNTITSKLQELNCMRFRDTYKAYKATATQERPVDVAEQDQALDFFHQNEYVERMGNQSF